MSCQPPLQDHGRWVCLLEMRSLNHHQTESACISATQTALTNLEVTGLFSALTGKEKDSTLMLMDCLQCTVNLDNFSKTMCTTMYSCKNHFLPCVDIIVCCLLDICLLDTVWNRLFLNWNLIQMQTLKGSL